MDRIGPLWRLCRRQRAEMALVALQRQRLFLGYAGRHPPGDRPGLSQVQGRAAWPGSLLLAGAVPAVDGGIGDRLLCLPTYGYRDPEIVLPYRQTLGMVEAD